jgi:predicted transcriptional regulator
VFNNKQYPFPYSEGINMKGQLLSGLSRRERQIMDIIYQKEEATAAEVRNLLPDKLTDSGVRTILRVLLSKGHLQRKERGLKYVYFPTVPLNKVQRSALQHLKETFFSNSTERVVTALVKSSDLSEADFDRLIEIIKEARKEGK